MVGFRVRRVQGPWRAAESPTLISVCGVNFGNNSSKFPLLPPAENKAAVEVVSTLALPG